MPRFKYAPDPRHDLALLKRSLIDRFTLDARLVREVGYKDLRAGHVGYCGSELLTRDQIGVSLLRHSGFPVQWSSDEQNSELVG